MLPSMADFTLVSRIPVPSLHLDLETWRHPCGLTHFHLACDDQHRAFAIAFRTPPPDSTGLPHILEHTALCGSRRYPVRDPFFNMLRRSLQTFMNAMTFPDLTAYPFASQVAKDFGNLLEVYLDAVFAPNLHPLDFAQEGHRLAPAAAGGWERQGVVFNEMKGAMDGTAEQLGMAVARALLPDTPYRHNYGGEPTAIPDLTHADLVAFHRHCYTPANAGVFTYGAVDLADLHHRLITIIGDAPGQVLAPPAVQPPLPGPFTVDVPVPFGADQDVLDVTAATLAWVWGDAADLDEALEGELLDRLLFGHAGAPLRLALESSGLGRSSDGSGYSAGGARNGLFTVQLNGLAVEDYPRFAPLVLAELERIARDGVPGDELEAALHQLELARREIHGDHYPHGLELCFRLLAPWNTGVAAEPFLDQAPAIARLRARFADGAAVAAAVRRRFCDHAHRGLFLARPDSDFHKRQDHAMATRVAQDVARSDATTLARAAEALAQRQQTKDDPAVLPCLTLADVPAERRWAEPVRREAGLNIFTPGTNGILHHLMAVELPALDDAELDLLPLLTQTVGQLGVGTQDYAARAAHLAARCAGVWAWSDIAADPADRGAVRGTWCCEVKGLADRHGDFATVLDETLEDQRFDELDRLRELIEQATQRLHERVQGAGNAFAARAAARGFGGAAGLGHRGAGLGRLAWLKRTAAAVAEDAPGAQEKLADIATGCRRLLTRLARAPRRIALIGDVADRAEVRARLRAHRPDAAGRPFTAAAASPSQPRAWTTASAVNYCALAFPTVAMTHPDAPALAVGGRLLVNQILHPRIREQGGAYGSGAGYTGATGTFALTSYRDPRLAATFADFRDGLRWLRDCPDEPRLVTEAVLGVIADVDTPASPAGEARARFTGAGKGVTPALLDEQRRRILAVDAVAVRAAAQRWLDPDGGTPAVVTSAAALAQSGLGWDGEAI